jgi:PAS domain S-box-containing protein
MPHGHCYLWTKSLVLIHVISDGLIALAYFTIPGILIYFFSKRKDLHFGWMFVCFAVFIVACGTTHVMEIWNVWNSNYWVAGAAKGITALASVPTAFLLAQLVTPALSVPSIGDLQALNVSLASEVAARREAENGVRQLNEELERRVAERTAECAAANADLLQQIAQKQHAEAELRERSEQLSLALEAAEIAHWELNFDSGRVSRSIEHDQIFGYEELQPEWNYDHFLHLHPDDRQMVQKRFAKCLETGAEWDAEYRIIRKDGAFRVVWARGKVFPASEGKPRRMLGVLADVTDRRRAEETANQLAAIVDSTSDAIFGQDLDGLVTSWNVSAERIFGYAAVEMINGPVTRLIPAELRAEEEGVRERVKQGERTAQLETVRVRKDGARIDVSMSVSPIRDAAGHLIGSSKIVREITEQKRLHDALQKSETRFRQLADSMPGHRLGGATGRLSRLLQSPLV